MHRTVGVADAIQSLFRGQSDGTAVLGCKQEPPLAFPTAIYQQDIGWNSTMDYDFTAAIGVDGITKTEVLVMTPIANKFLPACLFVVTAGTVVEAAEAQTTNLDWLSGDWCATAEKQSVEETWLSDVGGQMIGMSRTIVNGKVVSFEFMRIETTAGVTRFIAQPGGGSATTFVASSVSENQLVVENPEHDFPQKITYLREGDELKVRISGSDEAAQEQIFSFNYQLCP